jgi:hypothetical protein
VTGECQFGHSEGVSRVFVFSTVGFEPSRKCLNLEHFSAWHRVCIIKGMNTKLTILGLFVFGASLSSCAPNIVGTADQSDSSAYIYGQNDGASYNCPSSPNVVAPSNTSTSSYTACVNTNDATNLEIKGYSSTSRMICVYPMQYNGLQLLYIAGKTGEPLSTCFDAWSAPDFTTSISFAGTSFNGALVVDQTQQNQMNTCLLSGTGCPAYAHGKIR